MTEETGNGISEAVWCILVPPAVLFSEVTSYQAFYEYDGPVYQRFLVRHSLDVWASSDPCRQNAFNDVFP